MTCPTCSGPNRETVNMVCQTCGTDYSTPEPDAWRDSRGEVWLNYRKHPGGILGAFDPEPSCTPLFLLAQPTADEAEGDSREVLADVLRSANLKSLLAGHGRADAIDLADAAIAAGYRRATLATPPAPERNGLGGGSENPDSHEWLGTDR